MIRNTIFIIKLGILCCQIAQIFLYIRMILIKIRCTIFPNSSFKLLLILNRIFDINKERTRNNNKRYLFIFEERFVPEEVYYNLDINKIFDFKPIARRYMLSRERDWIE